MKKVVKPPGKDTVVKFAIIVALFMCSVLVTASGAWFAVFSIVHNVGIKFLNTSFPGILIALIMMFFGVRSFITVNKFRKVMLGAK